LRSRLLKKKLISFSLSFPLSRDPRSAFGQRPPAALPGPPPRLSRPPSVVFPHACRPSDRMHSVGAVVWPRWPFRLRCRASKRRQYSSSAVVVWPRRPSRMRCRPSERVYHSTGALYTVQCTPTSSSAASTRSSPAASHRLASTCATPSPPQTPQAAAPRPRLRSRPRLSSLPRL
jgi:hypothetical protein